MKLHIYCGGYDLPRKRLAVQMEPISEVAAAAILRGAGPDIVSHLDDPDDAYFMSKSLGNILPLATGEVSLESPEVGDVILQASISRNWENLDLSEVTWTALSLEEAP